MIRNIFIHYYFCRSCQCYQVKGESITVTLESTSSFLKQNPDWKKIFEKNNVIRSIHLDKNSEVDFLMHGEKDDSKLIRIAFLKILQIDEYWIIFITQIFIDVHDIANMKAYCDAVKTGYRVYCLAI